MNALAEVKMTVEVKCPFCQSWSRFHELSAAHSNVRSWLQKRLDGQGEPKPNLSTKCDNCSKRFTIAAVKLV